MKVTVRVAIGELMLRNSELESLEVVQELGQHTTCRIEFIRDRALDVNLETFIGDPVTVTVHGELSQPVVIFQGEIGDGTQTHLLNFGSRFVLEAASPSDRLEYVDTVYYPKSTLKSIAGKLGVKIVGSLRRTPPEFDHVQWAESEFSFLRRLVDEHGGFLVTSGAAPEIRSEFVDKGWELMWGDSLLEVSARAKPVNHGTSGASYDAKEKHTHRHAGVRQAPASLGGAGKLIAAVAELARAPGGGDPGLEEPSAREATHAEFKTMLRAESERALGAAVLVEGQTIKPGLAAGDLVNLLPGIHFIMPTIGKFGLIKVVHTFAEQHYTNRFVATPWKNFSSLERPERPTIRGPVTAEVVDDVDPDKMGRLKIKYRWQTDDATTWARLATPHTGSGRGIMFLPEVGDEVLVDFVAGDVEQPVIIGSLWNGKDQAPETAPKNTAKRIITRSGNTLQFLDDDDAETIELHTPEGKCLIQLTNKGGHPVVTIYSEGDIALEAKEEIRLKAKKLVNDIGADIVIKAGGDFSVDATSNVTLKAGMDAGLSGLNAIIKGGMNVESVAGAINNIVGTMVQIQPPGFMGKQVSAKPAKADAVDKGKRKKPEKVEPQRTADPATPQRSHPQRAAPIEVAFEDAEPRG